MRTIGEVKLEILNVTAELNEARKQLSVLCLSKSQLCMEKEELQNSLDERVGVAKQLELECKLSPIQQKLDILEKELKDYPEFDSSDEDIKKNYVKEYFDLDNLADTLAQIIELIKQHVDMKELELDFEDKVDMTKIKEYAQRFKVIRKDIKRLRLRRGSNLEKILDDILFPKRNLGILGIGVYIAYALGIFFLLIKAYSYVVLPLGVIFIYFVSLNFIISSKLFKYYKEVKIISNNLDSLFTSLDTKIEDARKTLSDDYDKEKEISVSKIKERITNLQGSLDELAINFQPSVEVFNLEQALNEALQLKENVLGELNEKIRLLEETIERLKKRLLELAEEEILIMEEFAKTILTYEQNLTCKILPSEIVYEVKPFRTFKITRKPCLFICEDESYIDFIRLFISQLLMKINPFLIRFRVYDKLDMARQFFQFAIDDDIFEINYKEDEILTALKAQLEQFRRTVPEFKNFENIDGYNKYMLEHDSITKEYVFLMYLNAEMSLLASPEFLLISRISEQSGCFPYVFINDLSMLTEEQFQLNVNKCNCEIYSIKDGIISKTALPKPKKR